MQIRYGAGDWMSRLAGHIAGELQGRSFCWKLCDSPCEWRFQMNTDQLKGNWKQIVGKAKEKWGKLTDNDWQVVEGKRDQLVGRIQERYGIAREEAERQVADFEKTPESSE